MLIYVARPMRSGLSFVATWMALAGCSAPAPVVRGETIVVVDTDLPVPDVVTNARIDVYAEDGRWITSRDVEAADPGAWPVSFGIGAGARAERRLVRVRVFPRHDMRDYTGVSRPRAETPADVSTPATLPALCSALPEVRVGGEIALRFGTTPFTSPRQDGPCREVGGRSFEARSGASGATVRIAEKGTYRFDVVRTVPPMFEVALLLRRDCGDTDSEVSCAVHRQGAVLQATDLEPGSYALLTTANVPEQAGEIIVRPVRAGAPASALAPSEDPRSDAGAPRAEPAPWPRLVTADRDETPATEPRAEVTSETFAFVDLVPGQQRRARILAGGSCLARPAELAASDETRLDVSAVRACADGNLAPPPAALVTETTDSSTRVNTFGAPRRCEPTRPDRVCVEGGMFVLGSGLFGGTGVASPTPERVASISTFYVDRDELSVGEYRAALEEGYAPPAAAYVRANEDTLDVTMQDVTRLCTYSRTPRGREDHPLNCVAWPVARALCQRRGGDLPTEAAWEYMARKAGRTQATIYPWGDEDASCSRAVHGRIRDAQSDGACLDAPGGAGPQPRAASADDRTPLGIRGLGGSLGEWCRDSFVSYEHPCWRDGSLVDPACDLSFAPQRSVRGGTWAEVFYYLPSALRDASGTMTRSSTIGFRCVYPAP